MMKWINDEIMKKMNNNNKIIKWNNDNNENDNE